MQLFCIRMFVGTVTMQETKALLNNLFLHFPIIETLKHYGEFFPEIKTLLQMFVTTPKTKTRTVIIFLRLKV